MARTSRWKRENKDYGIQTVKLSSWKYFGDYVRQELLDFRTYIWRGQRCSDWLLESTLDRRMKSRPKARQQHLVDQHFLNFKLATRGRRGPNPRVFEDDNEWWALGQHYGLSTPLLDWTSSPFVAAYFAFIGMGTTQTEDRAVFYLSEPSIESQSAVIASKHKGNERAPIVEFFRPLSDENERLVNQGGLFTRGPLAIDLEDWVRSNFPKNLDYVVLSKILIPNRDRELCLRSLNRMNINHATLFPDVYGACKFANVDLEIDNY